MDLIASVWRALKFGACTNFRLELQATFLRYSCWGFLKEAIYRKANVITRVLVHPVSPRLESEANERTWSKKVYMEGNSVKKNFSFHRSTLQIAEIGGRRFFRNYEFHFHVSQVNSEQWRLADLVDGLRNWNELSANASHLDIIPQLLIVFVMEIFTINDPHSLQIVLWTDQGLLYY